MDRDRVADARRQAVEREQRQAAAIRPLGLALLVVFLASAAQAHPRPSLHGEGLIVSVALAGFALAALRVMLVSRAVDSEWGVAEFASILGVAGACLGVVAWSSTTHPPSSRSR